MDEKSEQAMDLLTYWNLKERPFEATWDTRFFFQSRDHDEALNRLTFLVEERTMNMGMLTGEVGCGKTLTRAIFTQRLNPNKFFVVTQENSAFGFRDLLGSLLQRVDPHGKGQSKFARCERLKAITDRLHAEGKHLVLAFDEAQEMTPSALNELKLLTNWNGGGENYLTIVLLGQPELRGLVSALPAIDQRISLRFHLGPIASGECGAYLSHRLKTAGHPHGELFSGEAVTLIFNTSKGIPREINRLAKLALEYAWLCEMPSVNESAAEMIIRDLSRHQNLCAA